MNLKLTKLILLTLILLSSFFVFNTLIAETDIDSVNRWAWSDVSGWWDFYSTNSVYVTATTMQGYADSSIDEIALHCQTTPEGNICSSSDFGVANVGASGDLAGCAWNDNIGWISFWCGDQDCDKEPDPNWGDQCTASNYRVEIDADGIFSGYAWNDVEGWISFNCSNDGTCNNSDYKLETSWRAGKVIGYLESSIIDTQEEGGSTLQSIIWQGTQPSGTSVDFQTAVSNSQSGPWNYTGPSDDPEAWYGNICPQPGSGNAGPNEPICIDKNITANNRYLRYKIRLQSNNLQDQTPVIEDIILNWSR
ncbi:MAG: hypothetical protein WDZ80_05390 [Candidatus Paceibacterota bacterium]